MTDINNNTCQNLLVIGAAGSTGRRIVRVLLARGHRVTAFARHPDSLNVESPALTTVAGDALSADDVRRAMRGQDGVCVVLGNRHHPLRVRFGLKTDTPSDVRSRGTHNVICAMRDFGISRLLVQTTYGVGQSEGRLPLKWRLIFSLLLKPQIADTRVQEQNRARQRSRLDVDSTGRADRSAGNPCRRVHRRGRPANARIAQCGRGVLRRGPRNGQISPGDRRAVSRLTLTGLRHQAMHQHQAWATNRRCPSTRGELRAENRRLARIHARHVRERRRHHANDEPLGS